MQLKLLYTDSLMICLTSWEEYDVYGFLLLTLEPTCFFPHLLTETIPLLSSLTLLPKLLYIMHFIFVRYLWVFILLP